MTHQGDAGWFGATFGFIVGRSRLEVGLRPGSDEDARWEVKVRWVIISGLAVMGLADLMVLNIVAIPRYREELAGAGVELASAVSPTGVTPREPVAPEAPETTVREPSDQGRAEGRPPVEAAQETAPAAEAPSETEDPSAPDDGASPLPELAPTEEPPPSAMTGTSETPPAVPLEPAYFATGSAHIRDYVREHLKHVVVVLRRHPQRRVLIKGHTDQRGLEQDNLGLSRQRAEAVAQYLMANGISREQLEIEWVGESEPAALGDSANDWAKNRRVEILWR